MFDISIIIFAVSLVTLVIMFAVQSRKIGNQDYPSKDLSYDNFQKLRRRIYEFSNFIIHSAAIILSKTWARINHFIWSLFHKGVRHIDAAIMKHEKKQSDGEAKQSVFITTVKAYKHEIKKLKGRVEEEQPRPRGETTTTPVDFAVADSNIETPSEVTSEDTPE